VSVLLSTVVQQTKAGGKGPKEYELYFCNNNTKTSLYKGRWEIKKKKYICNMYIYHAVIFQKLKNDLNNKNNVKDL
jgi:hypothetical protein